MRDADLVLVGGEIRTMDRDRPRARGIAFGGGRILAVGTDAHAERWAGKRTEVVDLEGKVVLPGFIDAHAHLMESAARVSHLDLGGCASLVAALDVLRAAADRAGPGEWVVGKDWDESKWSTPRYLTAADLDSVSSTVPIMAIRVDRHIASANTPALEHAKIPPGTRGLEADAGGRPTGVVKEEAFGVLHEKLEPSAERLADNFAEVAHAALSVGIATVHDVVDVREIRAYQIARAAGRLPIRAYLFVRDPVLSHLASTGIARGFGDDRLRVGGVKVFADGSLGARTAALFEPYTDEPGESGMLIHPPRDLRAILEHVHGAGLQAAVHAIGDRAVELVIETLEAVAAEPGARHRIEHAELLHPEHIDRMRVHGIVASCQPNFIGQWSLPGGLYVRRLGHERTAANNPYRDILRKGVRLAFGSDGMPYGPLEGIHWAVNGPFASQQVTVDEAVAAYTRGAAEAGFAEGDLGTLAPGRLGDAVVLDGSPWRTPARIRELRVSMTVVAGAVAFRRR